MVRLSAALAVALMAGCCLQLTTPFHTAHLLPSSAVAFRRDTGNTDGVGRLEGRSRVHQLANRRNRDTVRCGAVVWGLQAAAVVWASRKITRVTRELQTLPVVELQFREAYALGDWLMPNTPDVPALPNATSALPLVAALEQGYKNCSWIKRKWHQLRRTRITDRPFVLVQVDAFGEWGPVGFLCRFEDSGLSEPSKDQSADGDGTAGDEGAFGAVGASFLSDITDPDALDRRIARRIDGKVLCKVGARCLILGKRAAGSDRLQRLGEDNEEMQRALAAVGPATSTKVAVPELDGTVMAQLQAVEPPAAAGPTAAGVDVEGAEMKKKASVENGQEEVAAPAASKDNGVGQKEHQQTTEDQGGRYPGLDHAMVKQLSDSPLRWVGWPLRLNDKRRLLVQADFQSSCADVLRLLKETAEVQRQLDELEPTPAELMDEARLLAGHLVFRAAAAIDRATSASVAEATSLDGLGEKRTPTGQGQAPQEPTSFRAFWRQMGRGLHAFSRGIMARALVRMLFWRRLDRLLESLSFAALSTNNDMVTYREYKQIMYSMRTSARLQLASRQLRTSLETRREQLKQLQAERGDLQTAARSSSSGGLTSFGTGLTPPRPKPPVQKAEQLGAEESQEIRSAREALEQLNQFNPLAPPDSTDADRDSPSPEDDSEKTKG